MDELKVGEYGRTDKGNIFIYANAVNEKGETEDFILIRVKNKEYPEYRTFEKHWLHNEKIIKHSRNIEDLLQVNDIIEVLDRWGDIEKYHIDSEDKIKAIKEDLKLNNYALKSILTKEQYNLRCYNLEA